jgi:hypothetical protein
LRSRGFARPKNCGADQDGDVTGAPRSSEAPQLVNTADADLRYLAISSMGRGRLPRIFRVWQDRFRRGRNSEITVTLPLTVAVACQPTTGRA